MSSKQQVFAKHQQLANTTNQFAIMKSTRSAGCDGLEVTTFNEYNTRYTAVAIIITTDRHSILYDSSLCASKCGIDFRSLKLQRTANILVLKL